MKENFNPSDKNILEFIRKYFLYPPNKNPYSLKKKSFKALETENGKNIAWNTYNEVLKQLFPRGGKPGFFVEAGASDGEGTIQYSFIEALST